MTIQEFSTEFDVLYNNITSNQAPGLNEYEKSVFLTKAQSQLINEYFNHRTDGVGGGFDGSQKRQYDFTNLIKTKFLTRASLNAAYQIDTRSIVYAFPKDFFLAINEILLDGKYQYSVTPISYVEYQRYMLKPYNFPVKRGAWRLFNGRDKYNEYSNNGFYFTAPVLTSDALQVVIGVSEDDTITDSPWTSDTAYTTFNTSNVLKVTASVSGSTVTFTCKVKDETDIHDADIIKVLKSLFKDLEYKYTRGIIASNTLTSAGEKIDWFSTFITPVATAQFSATKTMQAEIIDDVPAAEIIGKFHGIPIYQLRYIKRPSPIILEDLDNYGDDLTIDRVSSKSECSLPEETHREILERAVTLAKIAWQGGTATQAASAKQDKED